MRKLLEKLTHNTLLHPRHWLTWLGMAVLWLATRLPWRWQMALGRLIGLLVYILLRERRRICLINIRLAFPQYSAAEQQALVKAHFVSLGKGLLEVALSWWGKAALLEPIMRIEGLENLQNAHKKGGVLLVSAHFTSLEIGGRILAPHLPVYGIYRPHQNPVIEALSAQARQQRYGTAISRNDVRSMIKNLRHGHILWYAQDQHFRHKNRVFAPFFGVPVATHTGASRLTYLGKAQAVPCFTVRTPDGYLLKLLPALDNFPSTSPEEDAVRVNQLIEEQVKQFPEQYLWTHRRFKAAPDGMDRYKASQ